MQLTRPNARWLLIVVMLTALLFSRLALASYVCPQPQLQAAASTEQPAGHGCTQPAGNLRIIDEAQPSLCAQHSSDESQLNQASAQPNASEPVFLFSYPAALSSALPTWPIAIYADLSEGGTDHNAVFLLTRRLRI
ncbi:hypothetical protein L1889_11985 [Paenalcaligenes niemegkensis]|uniref:hypothetical protein n=1 Tax=Paenalcaligenes niemegkensis TaxID=2895469 RepID=UPI001EE7E404|nr:hypothetical protein [Paenalcaligenes niemegkensis]MCQ9617326.1 hypothetical protein [Paenalcaligenes niemegkensis]